MPGPLGTLIVVVLKARNLPNKQRIGKQDPYATCTYLSHRKRTKTDKRGGQHPVWDEELRFEVYESMKDAMPSTSVATTSTGGVAPIKSRDPLLGAGGSPGVKELRVAVYADDPRDPDLIGEGKVDLSDTLKKGEFDDWVTINNKGKYQGEVYLEMTFYSAKPPPETLRPTNTPSRAGVFEASSPGSGGGSGLRQPATVANNRSSSPSPLGTSVNRQDPRTFPAPLRAGGSSPGFPKPSVRNLPLPGQQRDSPTETALSTRQRSTGSLSIPGKSAIGTGVQQMPLPSRHQSFDQTHDLAHSMSSISLSQKPQYEQSASSYSGTPSSELGVPQGATPQRHHRHSFSGHSRPPELDQAQQPFSHGTPNPNPTKNGHSEGGFARPVTPASTNNQYHSNYSAPPQLIPQLLQNPIQNRRPLPVPGGGEAINRPTSAWGNYHHQPGPVNPPINETGFQAQQVPAATFSQYPVEADRPSSSMSVLPPVAPTNPVGYLPQNHHHEAGPPANHLISQPAYAEPPRQYHTPPRLPQNSQLPSHLPPTQMNYANLPPPPPGQAPIPIHEVYANNRPHSYQNYVQNNPYHPPPSIPNHPPQSQPYPFRPDSRLKMPYPHEPPSHDPAQHHSQGHSSRPESVPINAYEAQAPLPPPHSMPPHLQHQPPPPPPPQAQPQFQLYQNPSTSHSKLPPPPPSQMYFQSPHGVNAAPPPPSTPAPHTPNTYNYYQPATPAPHQNPYPSSLPPPPPPGNHPYSPTPNPVGIYGNYSPQPAHYPA